MIRSVNAGDEDVAPALAWGMLRELQTPRTSPYDELTDREREVLVVPREGPPQQREPDGT